MFLSIQAGFFALIGALTIEAVSFLAFSAKKI